MVFGGHKKFKVSLVEGSRYDGVGKINPMGFFHSIVQLANAFLCHEMPRGNTKILGKRENIS